MRATDPSTRACTPGLGLAERLFAVMLLLYPRRFRSRYGGDARGLFRDRYREEYRSAGVWGAMRYVLRTIASTSVNGPAEHFSHRPSRPGDGPMTSVRTDVRYALRGLRRSPGFTAAAVLALALGIGANTAIFSLINGVLLGSLPYRDPDTLMLVVTDASAAGGAPRAGVAPADLVDWRASNDVFTAMAAHRNSSLGLTALERPIVPLTNEVTANYFDVLGVEPLMGRTFQEGDDVAGNRRVVISHRIWRTALGGDPEIVGKEIELDDRGWTVIGVLADDFYATNVIAVQPDLWIPLVLDGLETNRTMRTLMAFGRLKEGLTVEQARVNMGAVAARIADEFPGTNAGWSAAVMPIRERVLGNVQQVFLVLLAAVGFVLLVACANVANLILARSAERAREVALRVALGASRGRLVQQLLTESVVLSLIAGFVAVLVSLWGIGPLVALIPSTTGLPFLDNVRVDLTVLAFSLLLSAATGVVCALAPAARLGRADLAGAIKSEGRSHTAGLGGRRMRGSLVVAEFALSLVLLVGAGLMMQTFVGLRGYAPGFDADNLLHLRSSLRGNYRTSMAATKAYFEELNGRLAALPGVESVSGVSAAPPVGPFLGSRFQVPGNPAAPGQEPFAADRRVLPRYFETMGIPLISGRLFDQRDTAEGAPVAIVNQALARRHYPDSGVEGMRMSVAGVERAIVGVVGDVRAAGADPTPVPVFYIPYDQAPLQVMSLIVRTDRDPALLVQLAEETAWGMGSDMNVYEVEPVGARLDRDSWRQRFATQLIGTFALLALMLGAAGIYSVLTYAVTQRTQEIGVRVALGASRGDVVVMVVRDGLRLALLGTAVGVLGALALTRLISGLLYEVSATDPLTFGGVAVMLLLVAIAACLVPAWRATRVDPMVALRAG